MTSIGETLRRERLRRNLELDQISRELKISSKMLEAIEDDRFDRLPGGVFAKSFVRQYAHLLELDEDELAAEVQRIYEPAPLNSESPGDVNIHVPRVEAWQSASDRQFSWGSWLPALALVVVVMLVCSGVYSWWQRNRHTVSAQEAAPRPVQTAQEPPPVAAIPAPAPAPAVTAPQQVQPPPAAVQRPVQTPAAPKSEVNSADRPALDPSKVASSIPAGAPAGTVQPGAAPPPRPLPNVAANPASALSNTGPLSNPNGPIRTAPLSNAAPGVTPNVPPLVNSTAAAPAPNPNAAVRVQVVAAEPVWVLARADGKYLFSGTLGANESRTVEANGAVLLRLGNAGGVTVLLNGKPLPALGPKGQVRDVQLTPGGFQIVAAPKPSVEPLL